MAKGRRAPWAHSPRTYLMAAGIGIIGGLVGVLFASARRALTNVIIGPGGLLPASMALPRYQRLLIPFAGAIVASILARVFSRNRETQGMADVMESITLRRARHLRVRPTIGRALSSLALITSGGAVGREGPIAYLSAALATKFARWRNVPRTRVSLFSGCGVAAGMSAAYYTPLGAALFALEVVLGNFAMDVLAPVVVSSVIACLIVSGFADGPLHGYLKPSPLYDLPQFDANPAEAYLGFIVMGVASALSIWLFIRTLRWCEDAFARVPLTFRLPLGGLLLGVLSMWLPQTWGGGHDTVQWLMGAPTFEAPFIGLKLWEFVFVLLFAKILATSITLGSGGWGGIFTPNILVGCCVGLLFGSLAHKLLPGAGIDPRSYAVVGMAAGLAAATQAPIMAMVFMLEMTREPNLIPSLMLACITASIVARALGLDSIYVAPLYRRGLHVPEGIEETTLTITKVKDLMREETVWVRDKTTFDQIVAKFNETRRDSIYVVNEQKELLGAIRLHDVKGFLSDPDLGPAVIAADLTVSLPAAHPEQTVADIIERFEDVESHEVAVVDPETGVLVGVVDRRDLITQLSVEVLQRRGLRAKFIEHEGAQHYVEMPPGHALSRIEVPAEFAGLTLAESDFHNKTGGLTVLTIVHPKGGREERLLPEAKKVLNRGDFLIVLGPIEAIRKHGGQI